MYIYTHIRVYILACDLQTFISDHSRNEESLPFLIWDQMNKIILQSMENWQSQVFYLSFKIVTKICAPEHSRTFASAYEFACVLIRIASRLTKAVPQSKAGRNYIFFSKFGELAAVSSMLCSRTITCTHDKTFMECFTFHKHGGTCGLNKNSKYN